MSCHVPYIRALVVVALVAGCQEPPPPPPKPTLEERAQDLQEQKFDAREEQRTLDPNARQVPMSELFPLVERAGHDISITYLEEKDARALNPRGETTGLVFRRGDKTVVFVGHAQCKQNNVEAGSILAGTGMKSIQFEVEGELFDPKTKQILEPFRAAKVGLGINVAGGCASALDRHGAAIGEDWVARVGKHL